MKIRLFTLLVCMLACTCAAAAFAAWIPQVPGWTAQKVPLDVVSLTNSPSTDGVAFDPVSGDLFMPGFAPGVLTSALMRVSQSGHVQVIVSQAGWVRPIFDPVQRILYQRTDAEILRFDEHGAPLPSIIDVPPGPIAVAPDGRLYSLAWHPPTQAHLDLLRYDGTDLGWNPVQLLPAAMAPWNYSMPDQMLFDLSGKLFLVQGGAAFRADDAQITFVGGSLLQAQAAVGAGFFFLGAAFTDAGSGSSTNMPPFALPNPTSIGLTGVAVTPDGRILFTAQEGYYGPASLVIFSPGATPTVRRSWGAVKTAAR
jgi:hypothetical protein